MTHRDIEAFTSLQGVADSAVADGTGGVAWALSLGGESACGAAGWLDPHREGQVMPDDGIFRVASVSKPIVAVAALQLVEQGLLGLDDPVDGVLPELADRRVLLDPHGGLDQASVPARRPLTLRDLLTFRCGLGMDFDFSAPQPVLERMWELGIGPGPTPPACGPDEFMARLGELPLSDQPGTRWRYHTGSDIVSVLIERVQGDPLDTVLARDVFGPCGMPDTGFWIQPEQLDRFGVCRMADAHGRLAVWDGPDGRWSTPPSFRSGAAGLLSTTADLIAFGRLLLADGDAPGGRVLTPASVAAMTSDQLTGNQRARAVIDDDGDDLGWGLGLAVRHRDAQAGWPTAGCYGWDGGLGSRWLVDPALDLSAVVLSTDAFESPSGEPVLMRSFVDAIAAICVGLTGRRSW